MSKKSVIGVFDDENRVVSAIKKLKENKVKINDVYGPFASHDILSLVTKPTRLPHLAFIFGAVAAILTFLFVYYTSVINYPLSYGGKPTFSFPPMVVIIYLITILGTATLTVFAFIGRTAMYPGKKAKMPGIGAMDDKFFVVIDQKNAVADVESLMRNSGAIEIRHEEF